MFATNVRSMAAALALSALMAGSAWAAETAPAAGTKAPAAKAAKAGNEVAVLETSKGRMVVEFWDKDAPQTVANFKKLARQGYFDGTGFHRIIKGFMIQGGDPKSKNPNAPDLGTGGPGYTINDEFNAHKHVKGVLSMANTGTPNSAGSQFFIMHGTAASLDGKYTAFGHLISGLDVLDKIANSPTAPNPSMPGETSKPVEWTTLKSVKITSKALASTGAKKAATKPAAKTGESKASMGAGTGVDMKAAETPASSETKTESSTTPPASEKTNTGGETTPSGTPGQ